MARKLNKILLKTDRATHTPIIVRIPINRFSHNLLALGKKRNPPLHQITKAGTKRFVIKKHPLRDYNVVERIIHWGKKENGHKYQYKRVLKK